MASGLVDSFCLSMAWTVVVLEVTRQHGLPAAGACSTAMLLGVALSAPAATWMTHRLDGRRLLRVAGLAEAATRIGVFVLLATGASVWAIAACVTAMNVVAWTGYAGMRAEVAAVTHGAGGITWYATIVAAVEALGIAAGAFVPTDASGRPSDMVLVAVAAVYVAALLPTLVVAGGSRVPRAVRTARRAVTIGRPTAVTVQGALLMLVASGPTLLAVALAAELHGRAAVGLAAVAFTVGSLLAPTVATYLDRHGRNGPSWWVLLALGMVAGWVLAPVSVAWLCVAQVLSGLGMTTLEGLLDTTAARRNPATVTATLARSTAARALGSSGGTAIFPLAVAAAGLSLSSAAVAGGLAVLVVVVRVSRRGSPTEAIVDARRPHDMTEWVPGVATGSAGS
jgi:hypothetical protein